MKNAPLSPPPPRLPLPVDRRKAAALFPVPGRPPRPIRPPLALGFLIGLLTIVFSLPPRAPAQEVTATPTPSPTPLVKEVEWDTGLGLSTFAPEVKPGCWYPVWIEIRANRAPVHGVAVISQPQNPLRVEVALDVSKGTRKIYTTYFRPLPPPQSMPQNNVEVALDAQPLGHDSITISLRGAQSDDSHVLALCEEPGAFNLLNRRSERDPLSAVLGLRSVIYSKPELIPDDPIALESITAMIIDTHQVRQLSAAQWNSIRGWVAQGGRLLLAVGRQQPFIQESPLKNPFGVTLSPPEPVSPAAIFTAGSDSTLDRTTLSTSTSILAAWPAPPPGGWDVIWLGDARHPFLAGKRVGQGWFSVCASSLDPPVMNLLRRYAGGNGGVYLPVLEQPAIPSPLAAAASAQEDQLGQSIQRGFAINLAGVRWVLVYLLLYNILALPVNWWVCRRLGHPHLAWPVLVLASILFAWYGYKSGVERQQQNFQVNEVSFVSSPAPGIPARARSLLTIFTPRRFTNDLPASDTIFLSRLDAANRNMEEALTLDFSQATAIRHVILYPWTVCNLLGDYSLPASGGILADPPISFSSQSYEASFTPTRLTNRTPYSFRRWWLLQGGRLWASPGGFDANSSLSLTQLTLVPQASPALPLGELVAKETAFAFPLDVLPGGAPNRPPFQPPNRARQAGNVLNPQPIDSRLFFIGEASGLASPLARSLASQKNIGCIFYEQPLPLAAPPTASGTAQNGAWKPDGWTARVTQVGKDRIDPIGRHEVQLNSGRILFFPLNTIMLELWPASPLQYHQPPAMLALSYTLQNYPGTSAIWTRPAPNVNRVLNYEMYDCPVEVFNFRMRLWEPLPRQPDATRRLIPAVDYLHPISSAIFLRLKAEPDLVIYRPRPSFGTEDLSAYTKLTGRQLFVPQYGEQLPLTYSTMGQLNNSRYANPSQRPSGAQLHDLTITPSAAPVAPPSAPPQPSPNVERTRPQ